MRTVFISSGFSLGRIPIRRKNRTRLLYIYIYYFMIMFSLHKKTVHFVTSFNFTKIAIYTIIITMKTIIITITTCNNGKVTNAWNTSASQNYHNISSFCHLHHWYPDGSQTAAALHHLVGYLQHHGQAPARHFLQGPHLTEAVKQRKWLTLSRRKRCISLFLDAIFCIYHLISVAKIRWSLLLF